MKSKSKKIEVVKAEKMGFCVGVKDAIHLADNLIESRSKYGKIYMLGMIVHNKRVINDLTDKGIVFLEESDVLEKKINFEENDAVIIRAHGALKKIYEVLQKNKINIFDAACIFVKRARNLLVEKENDGYQIVFIGDEDHPEVKGIVSHGKNVLICKDLEEVKLKIKEKDKRYYFLSQTTLNKNIYKKIRDYVDKNFPNSKVGNTICGATFERQIAVEKLAKECDVVLVIGGKNSSNTKKLYMISSNLNKKTYWIEKEEEINLKWFEGVKKIGLTAGASTPEKSIQEIENSIKGEQ